MKDRWRGGVQWSMNAPRTAYRLTLRFSDRAEALPVPYRGSRAGLVEIVRRRMEGDRNIVSVGVVKTGARTERFSFERGTRS